MRYETTTLSGKAISAEWKGNHIELVVWRPDGVWVEWAFTQTYAIWRWEWLLKNA